MQAAKNILQNDLKVLSNSGFWQQFHHDFQQHASQIDELSEWTQLSMPVLHSQLLFNDEYQYLLERAKNEAFTKHNLVFPLIENDYLRVNLISIKPECSLPLHDHPGSSGSMMLLAGNVRAIVCEQENATDNHKHSRSLLSVVENKIFSENETSCFTQDKHNIHSIEALTDRAVLMVVHTPPFAASQQSFFFTESPQLKNGSQMLVQRVRTNAFQKFSSSNHTKGLIK